MFKWIKRFFGLDYNDKPVAAPIATIEDAVANVPFTEVSTEANEVAPVVETKPVKEKKPRKPATKKAAPKAVKKTAKK